MKPILLVAVLALLVGVALAAASYALAPPSGDLQELMANIFLNAAAELAGLAIGLVAALYIARRLAREKLSQFGKPLIALIRQLREEGDISPNVARKSVEATVGMLSDGTLIAVRNLTDILPPPQDCRICALQCEVIRHRGTVQCGICHLPGESWVAR